MRILNSNPIVEKCWILRWTRERILSVIFVVHVQGVHEVFEMGNDFRREILPIGFLFQEKLEIGVDLLIGDLSHFVNKGSPELLWESLSWRFLEHSEVRVS